MLQEEATAGPQSPSQLECCDKMHSVKTAHQSAQAVLPVRNCSQLVFLVLLSSVYRRRLEVLRKRKHMAEEDAQCSKLAAAARTIMAAGD